MRPSRLERLGSLLGVTTGLAFLYLVGGGFRTFALIVVAIVVCLISVALLLAAVTAVLVRWAARRDEALDEALRWCTRPQPHGGPCNGWPCQSRRERS